MSHELTCPACNAKIRIDIDEAKDEFVRKLRDIFGSDDEDYLHVYRDSTEKSVVVVDMKLWHGRTFYNKSDQNYAVKGLPSPSITTDLNKMRLELRFRDPDHK